MYPGFNSQFQNILSSNNQSTSSSQFTQANESPSILNQRRQTIPISMQQVQIPHQGNQVIRSQQKQLTIQQSIHQNMQQALSQPINNQPKRQIQNVIQQHPMSQQQIQNPMMQSNFQHPQMPIIQLNTNPSNIQLQQINQNQICMINQSQPQTTNVQINQQNKLSRVDISQLRNPISNASEINQNINKDSNPHLVNVLQQFTQQSTPEPAQSFDDDEFIVEGIADEREVKGKRQYLVQWYGFSDDENTWEDESNLSRYFQLINDFRMNGPKQRTQKRVLDFISGYVSNGKVHYNVLYQNDEVAALSGLQARGSRFKQQLINFLERETDFPEKDRVVIPPKPPRQAKLQASSSDGMKLHSSAGFSEYEYEYVEEEEDNEKDENSGVVSTKKRIKRKKRVFNVSTDEPGSVGDIEFKEDGGSEANDEIKMQARILHDDPIENSNMDDM